MFPATKATCTAIAALAVSALCAGAQVLTFEQAKQRADQGDSFAQAVVALHYQLGWNTQKNPELAAKYAIASAEAGHPLGKFRLGALLRAGEGVPTNEQKGLALQSASFNALYNAQDPYSITSAAIMIFQGKVVGQNISEDERRRDAAALYKKAAEMRYAPAQFNYAMALNDGHGVVKDEEASKKYLSEALMASYPPAHKFALEKDKSRTESSAGGQSVVEGVNYEGQRWAYEFLEHENEPTTTLANDSAGLVLYADNKFVVRAAELQGTARNAKTELSFYDAQTCRLLSVVSVPNRVIGVHLLKDYREGVFCLETITPAKYRYDDFPLALVFVDIRSRAIERLPLVSEDYWLALNNSIEVNVSGSAVDITVKPGLSTKYLSSSPSRKEFRGISVELSEGRLPDERPDYEKVNRERHLAIIGEDKAGLSYLGSAATAAIDPIRSRGQFATGCQASLEKGGVVVRTTDAGRLSVLSFGTLSSAVHNVDSKGVFAPHVFNNGKIACVNGEDLQILSKGQLKKIRLPDSDANAVVKIVRGMDIFETPQSAEEWAAQADGTPRRLMFADNAVGYRCGNSFFRFDLSSDGFEQVSLNSAVKSRLQRNENNHVEDWDLASGTFVIQQFGQELPFFQRLSAESGEPVGEGWDGGGKVVYDGMTYSKVSNGWRAFSFIDDATTGGVSSCVKIEDIRDPSRCLNVAQSLSSNADPLALRVEGSHADIVYGAGDSLYVDTIDLSSGQIQRKRTWTYASRFGKALFDDKSGRLFIPNSSGFEVWDIFGSTKVNKHFDLFLGEDAQYALLLPNGFYAGSPGCESLLRLKAADGSVDGASIAQWRNRPAEVLKALGGEPEVIELLAKVTERWQKRIGFDPAKPEPKASDLPKVFVPERPPLWATGEEAVFTIRWEKSSSPLKVIIVRVNGVESARFECDALPTATEDKGSVEADVKLAEGQNWIEVTAEDIEGRRSDLQRFRTILKDSPTETRRYTVALGVSEYAKPELNLQFAAKDAKDLLEALAGKGAAGTGMLAKMFGQSGDAQGFDHVLLLTNDQVDRAAVEKIREFVGKSSESDEVILFCAGHGVLDDKLDYYYAGHDFDPERPAETGIKLDDLVGAVSSAKALKRLMLLDTCHAGVVGEKDEMLLAQMDSKLPSGVRAVAQRGMKVQQAADFSASDKQRFIEDMFSLPGTMRGVNIIGASAGAQFALESDKWNNGVFTASVIEGLRDKKADWNADGRITVSELKNYLGQRVSELTAGAQKPSVVAFEQDQDFDLLNRK